MAEERLVRQELSGDTGAVVAGNLPQPPLCRFHDWLKWRSDEGQRPSKARGDTKGTTLGFESELLGLGGAGCLAHFVSGGLGF